MTAVPRDYYEQMYAGDADPWGFETSPYEQRKYAITVASLPKHRYRSAFEPGCAIGVLSEALAARCDRLLATDMIEAVVKRAVERLGATPGVRVEQRSVPAWWPAETFDLIVLSEMGYYFDRRGLAELIELATGSLEPGGTLMAVHWRGATDYPLNAEEVHDAIDAQDDLDRVVHHVEAKFLLDGWERP